MSRKEIARRFHALFLCGFSARELSRARRRWIASRRRERREILPA